MSVTVIQSMCSGRYNVYNTIENASNSCQKHGCVKTYLNHKLIFYLRTKTILSENKCTYMHTHTYIHTYIHTYTIHAHTYAPRAALFVEAVALYCLSILLLAIHRCKDAPTFGWVLFVGATRRRKDFLGIFDRRLTFSASVELHTLLGGRPQSFLSCTKNFKERLSAWVVQGFLFRVARIHPEVFAFELSWVWVEWMSKSMYQMLWMEVHKISNINRDGWSQECPFWIHR